VRATQAPWRGGPCQIPLLLPGQDYCRHHSPAQVAPSDTAIFRVEKLRSLKKDDVYQYREGVDAYSARPIKIGRSTELDHILELHVLRDCWDALQPTGTGFKEKKEALLSDVRDAANQTGNLNFTTCDINNIKFQAIYAFQADYNTDKIVYEDQGIFPYLLDAKRQEGVTAVVTQHKLSRQESRNIQKAWRSSREVIVDNFADENPVHAQMIALLQDNIRAMKLV
jgi:hypothetical protein